MRVDSFFKNYLNLGFLETKKTLLPFKKLKKWCFPLDVCKKMPKMGRPTDLESWQPFTGLRLVIENPRLRCWGTKRAINQRVSSHEFGIGEVRCVVAQSDTASQ